MEKERDVCPNYEKEYYRLRKELFEAKETIEALLFVLKKIRELEHQKKGE